VEEAERVSQEGMHTDFTRHDSITIKFCQELVISHSNEGQGPRSQGLGGFVCSRA